VNIAKFPHVLPTVLDISQEMEEIIMQTPHQHRKNMPTSMVIT